MLQERHLPADGGVGLGGAQTQTAGSIRAQVYRLGGRQQVNGQHIANVFQNFQRMAGGIGARASMIFLVCARWDRVHAVRVRQFLVVRDQRRRRLLDHHQAAI